MFNKKLKVGYYLKMDEDKNDNIWNASGVILDIDSGGLNEIYTFFVLQFCSFLASLSHSYTNDAALTFILGRIKHVTHL